MSYNFEDGFHLHDSREDYEVGIRDYKAFTTRVRIRFGEKEEAHENYGNRNVTVIGRYSRTDSQIICGEIIADEIIINGVVSWERQAHRYKVP